jgi:hypothetical protein
MNEVAALKYLAELGRKGGKARLRTMTPVRECRPRLDLRRSQEAQGKGRKRVREARSKPRGKLPTSWSAYSAVPVLTLHTFVFRDRWRPTKKIDFRELHS